MADLAHDAADRNFDSGAATARLARAPYGRLSIGGTISVSDRARSPAAASDVAASRVTSVDALRGFAMFWIIIGDAFGWVLHELAAGKQSFLGAAVRFVGGQFMHAPWEGFRFYDLLFPLFVFVVGVSIVFSLSRLTEQEGKWAAHRRVLRRSLLLFVLGVIYYGGTSNFWPEIRLSGVLQRIALCYLFASLLFLNLNVRGLVVAFVTLLVGYWALMTFVPVPEVGAGSFSKDANLARWIDFHYLPGKLAHGDWDSEGLLSTLPAVGTCLLGVLAGLLLKDGRVEPLQKTRWFIGSGILLIVAGYLWGLQFPVIKPIWTSSFVLVAGGYSLLLLGICYLLIDIWGYRAWSTLFLWFGANAIALYMINNVVGFQTLASRLVGGDIYHFLNAQVTAGAGGLVNIAVAATLAIALARYLCRHKIFLRV
jgi:predicted acyltransferase